MIASRKRRIITLIVALVAGFPMAVLVVLRITGLLHPYSIPTDSMAPAVGKGDSVYMEKVTYFFRKPARGDILVFDSDGLGMEEQNTVYMKRLVGLPGETLRFSQGKLYVNDKPVMVTNKEGAIDYKPQPHAEYLAADGDSVTVPDGSYFVIGDNFPNSADSRYFGPIPAANVKGRIVFCYWPQDRMGTIK